MINSVELPKALQEKIDRAYVAATWRNRIAETGLDFKAFCKKHRLDRSTLSRHINLNVIPGPAMVKKIERILKNYCV